MPTIEVRVEHERGCGFRQPGAKYLVSGGLSLGCERLPVLLDVCPVCHAGIKPARGWTWVDPAALAKVEEDKPWCVASHCSVCVLNGSTKRAGLLWVGEKFYPSPHDFINEARQMGVSRRISAVPRDFILGETWVLFAHRKMKSEACVRCLANPDGAVGDCPDCEGDLVIWKAGIFQAFRPQRLEYVVRDDDSEAKLDRLEKQGFTLVKVIQSKTPMFDAEIATSAAVN